MHVGGRYPDLHKNEDVFPVQIPSSGTSKAAKCS